MAVDELTLRELDVLQLIACGLTNPEIGDKLAITEKTVRTHCNTIYSKLDVRNRTEAAIKVLRGEIEEINGDNVYCNQHK